MRVVYAHTDRISSRIDNAKVYTFAAELYMRTKSPTTTVKLSVVF